MQTFLPLIALLLSLAQANSAEPLSQGEARLEGDVRYFNLTALRLEGKGWTDTARPFDRLPHRAQARVRPPVWHLSQQSAGLCARFVTDSSGLTVGWTLTSENLAMPHMPATGVSGVDLYVRRADGSWRWVANGRPTGKTNRVTLVEGISSESREFCLYLPLYNGVERVEIGVVPQAFLAPAPERSRGSRHPIVFYGTSITQGGCASRPGMVHTAIVGRELDVPVVNLGFSGNGRMEREMADFLAELRAAVFVLDCLPNMDGALVNERVVPFVRRLRQSHPDTPILLVEDRTYADAALRSGRAARNRENRAALKRAFGELQTDGVKHLFYLPGELLLGRDGEDTVDGSHPTDLGFARQAEAFLKVLEPILAAAAAPADSN